MVHDLVRIIRSKCGKKLRNRSYMEYQDRDTKFIIVGVKVTSSPRIQENKKTIYEALSVDFAATHNGFTISSIFITQRKDTSPPCNPWDVWCTVICCCVPVVTHWIPIAVSSCMKRRSYDVSLIFVKRAHPRLGQENMSIAGGCGTSL